MTILFVFSGMFVHITLKYWQGKGANFNFRIFSSEHVYCFLAEKASLSSSQVDSFQNNCCQNYFTIWFGFWRHTFFISMHPFCQRNHCLISKFISSKKNVIDANLPHFVYKNLTACGFNSKLRLIKESNVVKY